MGNKWLGLPVWAWLGIGSVVAGVGWFLYKKHEANTAASTTAAASTANTGTASTDTSGAAGLDTNQYESLLALLQDIQGEVSTSTPPAATTTTTAPPPVVHPVGTPVPGPGTPIAAPPVSTPVTAPTANTYTVASGDSLFTIAAKKLGSGNNWPQLLSANKTVITNTALQHGATPAKAASGSLVYPGEILVIP